MRNRSAFASIDLPMLLCVLFLLGMLVAYVFSLFSGPEPWYAWILSGLVLPGGMLLLGIASALLDSWLSPRKPGATQPTTGPAEGPSQERP